MPSFKKISLKDIAGAAGVSPALVSFVLNGKGKEHRVGEQTEKHILKIAREMNYQPNLAAKSLRSGKTKTIGVVLSDISNPFFAQIARILEDEATKSGYTVLFGSSDEDANKMNRVVGNLINKGVDGLLVVPCEKTEKSIETLLKNDVPLVLFDRYFAGLAASYVTLNNFKAAYVATKHLIDAGYKSPGMVAYDINLSHMNERIRGYKQAMEDCNLRAFVNVGFLKHNSPRKSADKLVPQMIASGVDAFLFATNTISLMCLYAVRDANLEIPAKYGIVGFDGNAAFDFFHAPLSYIRQPVEVLSQKAIEMLIDVISHGNTVQSILIDGELIARKSTNK